MISDACETDVLHDVSLRGFGRSLAEMKGLLSVFALLAASPVFGMTFGDPVTLIPMSSITSGVNQRVVVWDSTRGTWVGVLNTGMPELKVGVWTALDNVATGLTVDLIVSADSGEQLQPAILATPETTLVAYHANTVVASVPVNVNVAFGDPVTVAFGSQVSTPALASADPGHVSVAWASHSADSDSILVAHSTNTGQSWSTPFSARRPTAPGFYTRSSPAIARSAPHRPEFAIVWEDSWHLVPLDGAHLAIAIVSETQVLCNAQVGLRAELCGRRWSASLASDLAGIVFGSYLMEGNGEDYIVTSSEDTGVYASLGHAPSGTIGQVQLDMRGETVLVVWDQDSKLFVRASLDRGLTWGSPEVITTVSSGAQPFVALRDDGQKAIVEYVAPGGFGGCDSSR